MTDWLKELDSLPASLETSKIAIKATDKTDKTLKVFVKTLTESSEEAPAFVGFDNDFMVDGVKEQNINLHLKSFYFKCTDGEGRLLSYCQTIDEAIEVLEYQFGKKLISVEQYH